MTTIDILKKTRAARGGLAVLDEAGKNALLLSMADMDSFGHNYTSPVTDGRPHGILRTLLRIPKTSDKFRDAELRPRDRRRQS